MKAFASIAVVLLVSTMTQSQVKPSSNKHRPGATSASAHKLVEIKVVGTNLYSPAQVIASTGLKVGQNVNEEVFQEATQKLGETRLFTNVAYSYSFSGEGTKLELQLTDNEQLVPVSSTTLSGFRIRNCSTKSMPQFLCSRARCPPGAAWSTK